MSKTIDFYFDFGSPTSYLAHTQLKKLAAKYSANLVYKPVLLGGIHKATNNTPPGLVPAKGMYMMTQDMPRFARRYGVELEMNPFFPINTLSIMRGCYAAADCGCFDAYIDAVFEAFWLKKLNLGELDVLAGVLSEAGLDADTILAKISDDSVKQALKDTTEEAVSRGAFGAPTMYIGDEMYFGQDRLDFVEEELAR